MKHRIYTPEETHRRKIIYYCLHIMVLLLSIFLIVSISIDTFKNIAFYKEPRFMMIQFWICILFLLDFFLEWILAEKKWHYLVTHFIFFLVAIPYWAIIDYFGWTFSPKVEYLLRYIPLVRGGYALALVVSWLTTNRATGLFVAYLLTLVATLYFSSVVFFVFEVNVNSLVNSYDDALWWAAMDMTTVGSNIIAVTPVGRVLSVLLAALGMMLFPIFTVYITNVIQNMNKRGQIMGQGNFLPESDSAEAAQVKAESQAVAQDAAQVAKEAASIKQETKVSKQNNQ
ncbi:MAG: two pore domain potassium channel family protein [Bacteroidales bacterium]|nr:two pore domain potassium channel family protein [Bacteroidales bacterium]